jgi:aryl-alcohol dehydrogenase-like predicted oxidoreductase
MKLRHVGNTDLTVSELGLGCSAWWAKSAFPEREAIALVHAAVDRGVTLFDTGPSYALGQAEMRLGLALKDIASHNLIIATKVGSNVSDSGQLFRSFLPADVTRCVHNSLKAIGRDWLDIVHLHGPQPNQITDELLLCMEKLKFAGLVRVFGINGYSNELLKLTHTHAILSTMMFDYNLLWPQRKADIDGLAAAGKGFFASTPLAQAYFSNKLFKPRSMADIWYLSRAIKKHPLLLLRGRKYRFVNEYPDLTGAQVALGYVLANASVTSAAFGTTSLSRLRENLDASDRTLPADIISRITTAGLE